LYKFSLSDYKSYIILKVKYQSHEINYFCFFFDIGLGIISELLINDKDNA